MRSIIGASVLGAIGLAQALAVDCPHSLFEKVEGVPRGWALHREAVHDEPIVLHVSLPNQNVDAFHQRVIDISTPEHPLYGQHLEGHEVKDFLKPLSEAKDAVANWLKDHNITQIASDDEWVTFRTSVDAASKLLKTKFSWFNNPERGETELRTLEYSVPDHISKHVDFVHPTIKFPTIRDLGSTIHSYGKPKKSLDWGHIDASDVSCARMVTPQCLFKLYNIHYGANAKNGNRMSFGSFLNESARYSDLAKFEKDVAPYTKGANFTVHPFPPAKNDQTSKKDATEANLDNQYSLSLTYPTPITEYLTAGCGPLIPDQSEAKGSCSNEPYLDFLRHMHALPNSALPQTLSISYGEDEQAWPEKLAKKVCSGFAQLGGRGVSVMFSSGDGGPGGVCENRAGTKKRFVPTFPATCPFVTAVGATRSQGPEKAASFSGGGFSNYFKMPAFQSKAVPPFLRQQGSKFKEYYNAKGRGFPDVSAQGVNFVIVTAGEKGLVDGTSCASPTFASVISLLNSARISSGKKPLGYLNPLLYGKARSAFTDITSGRTFGCESGKKILGAGWDAVKGWDAATGLGTPDFGKLLKIVAPGVKNKGGPV